MEVLNLINPENLFVTARNVILVLIVTFKAIECLLYVQMK